LEGLKHQAVGYETDFRINKGILTLTSRNIDDREAPWRPLQSAAALSVCSMHSVPLEPVRWLLLMLSLVLMAGCLANSGGDSTDPVVVENPVVFVERPLLSDQNNGLLIGDNIAEPAAFRPGARLFLKDRASPDSVARDISSRAFSGNRFLNENGALLYDVKDLEVSFDGSRVVFAMRAPDIEGADDEDQPTWNIWEYRVADNSLERLIASDGTAEEGQDIAPAYLPGGGIVFSSTRQRASGAVLLDEGKPQYAALEEERNVPAFVLHVMDEDGANIEQITFNQSHDLDPLVQDDGTILFSRWDNAGQTANNGFNLYRVNPDGTALTYLFGRHSHDSASAGSSIEYLRPKLTDTGRILAELRPLETGNSGAIPAIVDVAGFVEAGLAIDGSPGSGQSMLVGGLSVGESISLAGNYGSVSPLLDGSNRYLVSWSPCRLRLAGGDGTIVSCSSERVASDAYEAAPPVYGLWLLNAGDGTQRPIQPPAEGRQFDEAVLLRQRDTGPDFIPSAQYSGEQATLADEGFGVIEIRSVYDIDGVDSTLPVGIARTADPTEVPPATLPLRFLRIEKPVSIPGEEVRDFDNTAFGRSQNQSMREIVGYVPIEPDGSVRVAVPADIAFAISVLDREGQRIGPRHQNWLNLRAGETITCNGCHDPGDDVAHGRADAAPPSVYSGAATTGIPFLNTRSALFTDIGETMAQTWARINGTRMLGPDPDYVDQWTDPALAAEGTPFALAYADLETPAPILPECAADWSRACRIIINYEQHIHPLWGLERLVLDAAGEPVDYTCAGCHNNENADGTAREPEAQLDLGNGPSADEPDHFKAYRELLFNDNRQIRETINVGPAMNVAGARASDRFFDQFRTDGTHAGFLSPAELRLISEWLDIGGQYYNNPFDAPVN
jgi:hypothetical protein